MIFYKYYVTKEQANKALEDNWEKEMRENNGSQKKGIIFMGVFRSRFFKSKYYLRIGHLKLSNDKDFINKEKIEENIKNIPSKIQISNIDSYNDNRSSSFLFGKSNTKKFIKVKSQKTSYFISEQADDKQKAYSNEHMRVTSEKYSATGGTLGAIGNFEFRLFDQKIKGLFGITNHHVIKSLSGKLGDDVYLNHNLDQNTCSLKIGEIFCANINDMDVAFVKIDVKDNCNSSIFKDIPKINNSNIDIPNIGDKVYKVGLTELNKIGNVLSDNAMIFINFSSLHNKVKLMKNQILTDQITDNGDSGAILWKKQNCNAVGLLFAKNLRNDVKKMSVATPLFKIIKEKWENDYTATSELREIKSINLLN